MLFGNDPGTGASGPTVVKFYKAHRTSEIAGVFVVAVAAIAFTFFLSALRRRLELTVEGRRLSAVVTAGGAIYVVGYSPDVHPDRRPGRRGALRGLGGSPDPQCPGLRCVGTGRSRPIDHCPRHRRLGPTKRHPPQVAGMGLDPARRVAVSGPLGRWPS